MYRTRLHSSRPFATTVIAALLIATGGCFYKTTPLHEAARKNDPAEIRRLVAEGDPVDARKHGNTTPLALAVIEGNYEAAEALLAAGASVDAPDSRGDTPLMMATKRDRERFFDLIMSRRPALDQQNGRGRTALHFAASRGQLGQVRRLLAAGAKPTIRDQNGKTAAEVALTAEVRDAFSAYPVRTPAAPLRR